MEYRIFNQYETSEECAGLMKQVYRSYYVTDEDLQLQVDPRKFTIESVIDTAKNFCSENFCCSKIRSFSLQEVTIDSAKKGFSYFEIEFVNDANDDCFVYLKPDLSPLRYRESVESEFAEAIQ